MLLLLLLTLAGWGQSLPSPAQVKQAITRYFANPLGASARQDGQLIMRYAVGSPDVDVEIDAGACSWMDEGRTPYHEELTMAYSIACVEARLQQGPGMHTAEALSRVFEVYAAMRRRDSDFHSVEVEKLQRLAAQGRLESYLRGRARKP